MAKDNKIRKCKYAHCLHKDPSINIETEKFVRNGNTYYHEDCYKTKEDILYIKEMWQECIDELVVFGQLLGIVNRLIFVDKVSSDYMVFAIKYCIDHPNSFRLQHPPGIKYILGNQKIKEAYAKEKNKAIAKAEFKAIQKEDNEPKFTINKKPSGFGSILGGN